MKTTISRSSWLLMVFAGALVAPAFVSAQGAPPDTIRRTIFFGARVVGGFSAPDTAGRSAASDSAIPARVFESMSAPFVTEAAVLRHSGRCVGVGRDGALNAGGVLLHGEMSVLAPTGATGQPGSRWLLVRQGPFLAGLGAVAIPTGVARLTSGSTAVTAGQAEVVAQFDAISCDDRLVPMGLTGASTGGRLTTVSDGARGRVAWVANQSLLPTLQHALILDMGAAAGVRAGDRVTIFAEDGSTMVAMASVVRVGPRSASAVVVRQALGSIAMGLPVRVTEKLP